MISIVGVIRKKIINEKQIPPKKRTIGLETEMGSVVVILNIKRN